jgi:hypothetical protein
MNEARALRSLVEKARRESYINRLKLVQRLVFANNNSNANDSNKQPAGLENSTITPNNHASATKRSRDESTALAQITSSQYQPTHLTSDALNSCESLSDKSTVPSDSTTVSLNSSKRRKTKSTYDHQV